jgi:uncharacterized phage protein gp47/JayE
MTTMALQITPTGASAPSYSDILSYYQSSYHSIYGSDADLTPASQDGQFLAMFAQAVADNNAMGQAVYSSFSPRSAQRAALSSLVKINGLKRNGPTQSTATVTVTGIPGAVINYGLVGDNAGFGTQWTLPPTFTIPGGGSIDVAAICTTYGAITATTHTLTQILNPQLGWYTVTNANPATAGQAEETDAQLQLRRDQSVAIPSVSAVASVQSNLGALAGVNAVKVYENDTDTTNSLGINRHSIAAVVQGGTSSEIASTIQVTKSPGCSTQGTSSLTVVDPAGVPKTISWYPLTLIPMQVVVHVNALTGFNANTETYIKQAIAQFVSGFGIGDTSYLSRLYAPAQLKGDDATLATGLTQTQLDALLATYSINSILQCALGGTPVASDLTTLFYRKLTLQVSDISVLTP